MAHLVDALPYIDHEYSDQQVRLAVQQMVEDETRRYKQTKNYLEALPGLPPMDIDRFVTERLNNEFERLRSGKPMVSLSTDRYKLPSPSAGKLNDVWAWKECFDNSCAQLEHKNIQVTNLELMAIYGPEAWKMYNKFLYKLTDKTKVQLDELKKQIQALNLERKTNQVTAGEKIKMLEETWVALVSKNYEIERACMQLESEIASLQSSSSHQPN